MGNDAEHLVKIKDGKRFYEDKYLSSSTMLWKCTILDCNTPPKPQRRGQYKDKMYCNACSNRLKAQNPEFLKKRGQAISQAIGELGDKWSKIAKINNANPETRNKISSSMKEYIKENKQEALAIRKEIAIKNNKTSGFGSSDFSKQIWANLQGEERNERVRKTKIKYIDATRKIHVGLMSSRYPDFQVVEFNHPDNTYRCPKGHIFAMRGNNFLKRGNCPICSPKSKMEVDFHQWILAIVPDMKTNKRVLYLDDTKNGNRALEIDLYSDSLKFGIELHGLFYHKEKLEESGKLEFGVSKNFHRQKADLADKHEIKLLQFFEDEIVYKTDMVKSIILAKLGGQSFNKIYARKCDIKILNNKDCNLFLDNNHLQGHCKSFLRLGLFHNEILVSVLTFRNKKDSKNIAEIARYCTLLNTGVVGGFSRLLSKAEGMLKNTQYEGIHTYSDRRYSSGEIYKNNGFSFVKTTETDWFWVKKDMRYARQISWNKSKEEMSKYAKIYGTGHLLWEKNLI